ncbi:MULTISPECIES: amidohydrolase [unclassified Bradyrhizobium]|uniref:amidohydrolase n=1 Tax=unclassified Bradyrhizobium TaxID=2631580 RepID=UPI0028ED88FA|nr:MULTISPECIES: amidohydrolase [unclassified Bradyrhizobium]
MTAIQPGTLEPPAPRSDLLDLVDQLALAVESKVIEWRREIHARPELACKEFRTSSLVAAHLRALRFDEVRTGLGGGTGVIGVLRGSMDGPVIALRADMDALPVREETGLPFASKVTADWGGVEVPVMHACGHDAHTAVLMGAAEVLAALRDDLPGTVLFVFQPAEEGPPPGWVGLHGAKLLLAEGALSSPKPEAMYGIHVVGGKPPGTAGHIHYHVGCGGYAMRQFKIVVEGKGGHASMPWRTIDPLVVGAQILLGLQTIISRNTDVYRNQATLSIGSFRGGEKFNVIPDVAVMEGALRVTDAASMPEMERRLSSLVEGMASAVGALGRVEWGHYDPQLTNDIELCAIAASSLERAAGPDGVVAVAPPFALDDFAQFSQHIPSLFFTVDVPPEADQQIVAGEHHTPTFYVNEAALIVGVRAFVHLTIDTMRSLPGRTCAGKQ